MEKTRSPHEHRFAHPHRNISALGVDEGMKVADFGAGGGAYTLLLAHAVGNGGRVYAVDVQRDLLRRIHNEAHHRGLNNVDVIWGDLETQHGSKLADRSIDLVLISNLLFQISDMRAVFDEAWRILKPDGRLAVIEWGERPPRAVSTGVVPIGPHRDALVHRARCIAQAHARGFKLTQEFHAGAHHYGLVFNITPKQL
jgi:ubiquinone/menaquinone biosynthesis C-methylase UbiE